jgi:DNA-binding beta-propeller fold protein YncE
LRQIPASAQQTSSWMMREAASENLLYVSDIGTNEVDVYPYPSGSLVGKLTGFGSVAGLCVNKGGDVFVVDEAGPVQVFAHAGTSPIRKLTTSGAPYGCAIDPTTGNLALTNLSSYSFGAIAIYPKANGSPKEYTDGSVDSSFFCGYDTHGNLFVDGWNRSADPILLKLAKNGKQFGTPFNLNASDKNPTGVQWDGKYVAVGNKGSGVVYRIDGSTGKTVQSITLKNGLDVEQFWLDGSTLIGPNFQVNGAVAYWHYPAGGTATKTISSFSEPFATTVSLAKK